MPTEIESQPAAQKAPQIMATVTLQLWGGHKGDYAIEIETVEFNAAPILATLSAAERAQLVDSEADDIFYSAVRLGLVAEHVGPFDVHVREALDRALEETPDFFEKFAMHPVLRGSEAVLETPLSPYELGARADNTGIVSGLVAMELSELIENDIEQHNDAISDYLIGSSLLMQGSATPVAVRNNGIILRIIGDASMHISDFSEEEQAQFNAGRAIRAAEGV